MSIGRDIDFWCPDVWLKRSAHEPSRRETVIDRTLPLLVSGPCELVLLHGLNDLKRILTPRGRSTHNLALVF